MATGKSIMSAKSEMERFMETFPTKSNALLDRKAKLEKMMVSLDSLAGLHLTRTGVKAEMDKVTAQLLQLETNRHKFQIQTVRAEMEELGILNVAMHDELQLALRESTLECIRADKLLMKCEEAGV